MPALRSDVDPDGLLEFSVVFTDRALNHMSVSFQSVINDISTTLKNVYAADALVIVPGGGTYGMESVARQFANDAHCLVIRNGWFSFRWSQILEQGRISNAVTVCKAAQVGTAANAPFAPADPAEVVAAIRRDRPAVVFAPHVETASGILLPDDYIREVAGAARAVGALFVLDCIASGALWADMRDLGVDVLISAPQKGWSASPCAAFVLLGERALERVENTRSSSFACDLGQWLNIMRAYESGGHAYHATMPTDALRTFHGAMLETGALGFDWARDAQIRLGAAVRNLLQEHGYASVAAPGYEAPGVVVSYTDDPEIQNGAKFRGAGLQIAAGVPLRCDEPEDFCTFRLGLFGLDKLQNVERTVDLLRDAFAEVSGQARSGNH